MATILPRPSKRQKLSQEFEKSESERKLQIPETLRDTRLRVQFVNQATGKHTGDAVLLPLIHANVKNLETLLNQLQGQDDDNQTKVPYRFSFQFDQDVSYEPKKTLDIDHDIYRSLIHTGLKSTEDLIFIQYTPQAIFRVKAVTRCSASVSGHGSAILATQFSPSTSSRMVSGSGDCTARIWDCDTGTPYQTLKGHRGWVLAVSYSPDGSIIATGSYDNTICIWDSGTGKLISGPLKSHTKWITSLAWEPFHLQRHNRTRLASSSKDASVRVWDISLGRTELHLTRHRGTVSCVKWGGTGNIYTSSHDKTVMIWDSQTGSLLYSLTSHVHWVNHIALSSDFTLRTAFHDPVNASVSDVALTDDERLNKAKKRFNDATKFEGRTVERLVTASDDCTMFLWNSGDFSKPVARLLGHQKQVNHVTFSPDGHYIASCGFDNHIKLWQSVDGKFLRTLRGHVAAVYQCAFSSDSRLLVSASKDTTLKTWDVKSGLLLEDLPGHKDEVFAVDWSPDGKKVCSGGNDRTIKLWSR